MVGLVKALCVVDILMGIVGMVWAFALEGAQVPGIICSMVMLVGIISLDRLQNV